MSMARSDDMPWWVPLMVLVFTGLLIGGLVGIGWLIANPIHDALRDWLLKS